MTPKVAKELFGRFGNMSPSKSSLDRLPKILGERWEEQREPFEEKLRMLEVVPEYAATVAVSLDGVMGPMKDGDGPEKRAEAAAQGQQTSGPAGFRRFAVPVFRAVSFRQACVRPCTCRVASLGEVQMKEREIGGNGLVSVLGGCLLGAARRPRAPDPEAAVAEHEAPRARLDAVKVILLYGPHWEVLWMDANAVAQGPHAI